MQCNSEYRLIAVLQEFAFLMRLGSNLDCCCLSVNLPGGLALLLRTLSVLLAPAACWYPRGITHLYTMAPISVRSFVFFQCRSACKGCDCGQVWISPLGILKCLFVNRRSGRRLRGGATQTGGEVEVRPFCVLALLSIAPPKSKVLHACVFSTGRIAPSNFVLHQVVFNTRDQKRYKQTRLNFPRCIGFISITSTSYRCRRTCTDERAGRAAP